ncbi:MAG TPA: FAD-dependent oxidoreductase, partial [Paracoccaceae bacterium]|nr:FAD-dependent oxidoreductase [Paracoccaceae bacterium]
MAGVAAAAGAEVTVVEAARHPGGKMRALPSVAGPVDAGPTVLTLRDLFDAAFEEAGERLEDHLTLTPLPVLARHWWPGSSDRLDLHADPAASAQAIAAFAGARAAAQFRRFDDLTARAFAAFDAPVMQAARLSPVAVARAALRAPALWPMVVPGMTLDRWLRGRFDDPRLVQLFGRFATYVGGCPQDSPAILALIWQAEARGVWAVDGGMGRLAQALAGLVLRKGGTIRYGSTVAAIETRAGRVASVRLASGEVVPAGTVVFNGDPRALRHLLDCPKAAPLPRQTRPRSLSA